MKAKPSEEGSMSLQRIWKEIGMKGAMRSRKPLDSTQDV